MGLLFVTFSEGQWTFELVVYADADYASKATDRTSVYGGAVMYAGACVCWCSRSRKCVTLSTTKAECLALADSIKEAIFITYVWSSIVPGFGPQCIEVFNDNEGSVQLEHNPIDYACRTRRILTFATISERACVPGRC